MGKLQRRLTITPHGTLLGWHRLHPDRTVYSGQLFSSKRGVEVNQYVSYLEFVFVQHFPHLTDHWDEHYLGETKDGVLITMFIKHRAVTKGPSLL